MARRVLVVRLALSALCACFGLAVASAPLHAAVLFGAEGSNLASDLFVIDPATGAATSIGPIGAAITGLAVHPRPASCMA